MEIVAETKVCKKCGVERTIDRFDVKHGRQFCRECWNARVRRYKAIKRGVPEENLPSGKLLADGFKCCTKCCKVLPHSDFNSHGGTSDGRNTRCRECSRAYGKKYRQERDPAEKRRKRHEYYLRNEKGNPNRKRAPREWHKNWNLTKKYGITLQQYNDLLQVQDFKCAICGKPFEKGNGRYAVVDHDHNDGHVRGLLHRNCNLGLGHLGDCEEGLLLALDYLRRTAASEQQPTRPIT
jgi:hypothetical protein